MTHAMTVCGARTAGYQENPGYIGVRAHWTHWPCLLPQHGPGAEHRREITLTDWQQEFVDEYPGRLVRGLFHSDGSRFINRVITQGRPYSYPRYNFVNESVDIMRICQKALDRLGIDWRMAPRNALPVARRSAVARLDEVVGPKW
ncbi:hypothetical protein GCM10010112_51180 [Actinoplanes lobatus]|uniref:Uncharacterized protein n=1 Tax=Actinoplanes lobatus TaxID=113568 RepID=A0A7W7HFF4_9ACTN|nr:hypothetical protein [Actinoplanes lobatus]MBB4749525.1 hypothetical protein [Actinoplanes lobatus]GGN77817.1 hypothetical protein GCM10010112_51180 [Actinoplanes lobatus]GIE38262.1 hypothetical protein Alo02nite_11600 [Actinoplanes lobatus]